MNKRLGIIMAVVVLLTGVMIFNAEAITYMMMSTQYEKASFEVDGDKAIMTGAIDRSTINAVQALIDNHPEVKTIVMKDVPGSLDDESNLVASRLIREAGINTHVPSGGIIASGGTDFFCAGANRTVETGAEIGVHSWAGDGVNNANELPKDHLEHQKYIDFYNEMKIPETFYWFTIQAAPAEGMHFMSIEELEKFNLITEPAHAEKLKSEKSNAKSTLTMITIEKKHQSESKGF